MDCKSVIFDKYFFFFKRCLYNSDYWHDDKFTKWRRVKFEHPASLETLAMEPSKKEEIIKDLDKF